MGDVNGDGMPDVTVANYTSGSVSLLLNTTVADAATLRFPRRDFTLGVGSAPYIVTMGDVNGNGRLDLVVTRSGNRVSLLLNTTTPGATIPSFSSKSDFVTDSVPFSVTMGDVNGDGKVDLAVSNIDSNNVSLLLNTTVPGAAAPSFAPKSDFATGNDPTSVAMGDLNGDGNVDLAVANFASSSVSLLLNTTTVGFTAPSFFAKTDFATGANPTSVTMGDVNGDGRPTLPSPTIRAAASRCGSTPRPRAPRRRAFPSIPTLPRAPVQTQWRWEI